MQTSPNTRIGLTAVRLALLALLSLGSAVTLAADTCVVVLMHGKWGGPQSHYLRVLAQRLSPVCKVELREMPWSRFRNYDQTYEAALGELAETVTAHRRAGVRQVILGGQSFGANAALAYQAQVGDADAILALAPGHSPELMYRQGLSTEAVDRARALIEAGKGADMINFTDLNQGERKSFRISADVLYSYFNPGGLGHMPLSAQSAKRAAPLLWVIGTADPLYGAGPAFAYERAPAHPLSRYLVVQANHANTPEAASEAVVEWVKQVLLAR